MSPIHKRLKNAPFCYKENEKKSFFVVSVSKIIAIRPREAIRKRMHRSAFANPRGERG